jgi:DHA1 family multidrug resistance protein-like MFS transporter
MNANDSAPPQPSASTADEGYWSLLRAEPVLVVIMATVAGHLMIMGMLLPVLPLYAQTFGVSDAVLGLVITAFGIGRLLIDIPAGLLADRLGRKVLLFGGPLLIAVGSVGCALATDFSWLVAWRFLQGLGAGAYMTAAMIVAADVSSPETRGRIMALHQSALLVGAGSGPAVGGFLAAHYGYQSVFWVSMAIGLGSATFTLWRYRETKRTARHAEDHSLRAYLPVLANPALRVALIASFGMFLTRSSAFMQLLPLSGAERFKMGPGHMGIGFALLAAANLSMLPYSGRLVQRIGTVPMVVMACVGLAAGMALAGLTNSIFVFFIAMIVLGAASGLEGPSLSSYAVAHAPGGRFGPTTGAMRFVGDLGFVVGPVMFGVLVDNTTWGYRGALLVTAAILVVIAALFASFAKESR